MMRLNNSLKTRCLAAAALAALGLGALATPLWASRLVQAQVSGQVTSVEGNTAVTIDGTTYLIAANSAAYQAVQNVHVGDTIGLVLSGPPGLSTSQVIYIVTGTAAGSSSSAASAASGTSSQ